jgi:hypothetical protein
LESALTTSPNGTEEECALFKIDTTSNFFVFSNITTVGEQYTLTIWVKSTASKNLVAAGTTVAVTTEWKKHIVTFVADSSNMLFQFQNTGNYYIYHAKLELGNISTDWTPAPEDSGDEFSSVNQELQIIRESVSQQSINADGITETVSRTETAVNTLTGEVESTRQEISEVKQAVDSFTLNFQKISDDGVDKVTTKTGFTFNEEGLSITKTDSSISTQITEDGMTVSDSGEALLTANHNGVEAKDLHARTYLIVGGKSRFENYGSDRTGCFWIGEG